MFLISIIPQKQALIQSFITTNSIKKVEFMVTQSLDNIKD